MFLIAGMTVQLGMLRALVAVSGALRKGSENKWVQRAAAVVGSRTFWIRLLLFSVSLTCMNAYLRFSRANTLEITYASFLKLMEKVCARAHARMGKLRSRPPLPRCDRRLSVSLGCE